MVIAAENFSLLYICRLQRMILSCILVSFGSGICRCMDGMYVVLWVFSPFMLSPGGRFDITAHRFALRQLDAPYSTAPELPLK